VYDLYTMNTLAKPTRHATELARTQVYLSSAQIHELIAVGKQTALSKSELIRTAIDQFLEQRKAQEQNQNHKKPRLLGLAGLWAGHEDTADVAGYVRQLRQPRSLPGA
jgi:Arc/MetJ-type ribon-helix-helix transcriptional regulator